MKDFVRIIPKAGYTDYLATINRMSHLFAEAEYQMVTKGYRDAGTIHISQESMDYMLVKLNKLGLIFTPLRKSGYYQGFAHTHKQVKPGEPFYWYGCMTKTLEAAEAFTKADIDGNHAMIGKLLGFPVCCTDYFTNTFSTNYDPIWISLSGNISGYPEANQMLRYFGIRITSHLSCSPTCESTRLFGQKWLEVMDTIDHDVTLELQSILSRPFTWDNYHGIVQVETEEFVGLTHSFNTSGGHRIINWQGVKYNG